MKFNQAEKHNILVTGGAGFIGSHLVDELINLGHSVTIIDNLDPQVHPGRQRPKYLNVAADFIQADIREPGVLESAIRRASIIFHLAASTAVGQSAEQINDYISNNIQATGILWDRLVHTKHSVGKVVLASSRAVYGEGLYRCRGCEEQFVAMPRLESDLKNGVWEVRCPACSDFAKPLAAHEQIPPSPASIYAVTKYTQEQISLCCARALDLPVVVLRFSNVYGDRQSMSNPYVGISSIFAANVINHRPVEIYEDGLESRDFVYVKDVVQACLLALQNSEADNQIFNVGGGQVVSIMDVARAIVKKLDGTTEPKIVSKYRVGDIRHLWLDISKIKNMLGYEPAYSFDRGIECLIDWVRTEKPSDYYPQGKSRDTDG